MEQESNGQDELLLLNYDNFLDLSDFSPDKYNREEAIVYMYKMALLHSSYGNYGNGKPPPLVNREVQQSNLTSYFNVKVTCLKKGHSFMYWLNRWETIEVRIFVVMHVVVSIICYIS
jgi:hypothetical protein